MLHYNSEVPACLSKDSLTDIDAAMVWAMSSELPSVVDQYVFSGRTISFAAQMLRSAGVEGNIGGIRGLWYNGISYQDIDHQNLCAGDPYVSAHMKAIGRKACQRAYAA
jgi:hypothetical protein